LVQFYSSSATLTRLLHVALQGLGKHQKGNEILDVFMLKQGKLPVEQSSSVDEPQESESEDASEFMLPANVEYSYRVSHPLLQWLPEKLALWVAENMRNELGFPDKASEQWTAAELNTILKNHLVSVKNGGNLFTFGCVEWESESYRGILRSRCYPFDMPGHRFHGMNIKVIFISF
jgi:hypothetical protein